MRTPRRPPARPHHEPRETEFVSLLLAETSPAPRAVAPIQRDDDIDDVPAFLSDGKLDKISPAELDAPVRVHTRKL